MKTIKKLMIYSSISAASFWSFTSFALDTSNDSTPLVQLGLFDSSEYGIWAHGLYANHLTAIDTGAFLLDFGSNQFRIGLTWGRQLSEDQRIKIGIEHFGQNNNINFAAGDDHQFFGQNAIGATYQYLFTDRRLQAISFSSYYAVANDGDFVPRPFDVGSTALLNIRDVAGGTLKGFSLGPTYQLWHGAEINPNLGYDSLQYNSQNEPAKNSAGIGPTVNFIQGFSPRLAFTATVSDKQPYQYYQAGLNWLALEKPCSSLEMGLLGSHFHSNNTEITNNNVIGLNLTLKWGGTPPSLTTDHKELLNWTLTSPASLPAVFVMRDQTVVAN